MSNQSPEVHSLTRRINDREDTIQSLRKTTMARAAECIAEVILQGADLIHLQEQLNGSGDFLKYIAAHCPSIEGLHALAYMRAAKNPARFTDVRQLLLMWPDQEQDSTPPKREPWDGWYGVISSFAKWTRTFTKTPITTWPPEGKDRLRAQLEPIASELWPERFKA